MDQDTLPNLLTNCIFTGRFTDEILPNSILLDGFRNLDPNILKKRFQLCELFQDFVPFYCTDIYLSGIERIRSLFDADDIIKMLTTSIKSYDSLEFEKVVEHNLEIAKELYGLYVQYIFKGHQKWYPKDLEIYGSKFGICLTEKQIRQIFFEANPDNLRCAVKYTNIDEVKIAVKTDCATNHNFYLHDQDTQKFKLNIKLCTEMLNILLEAGIKVVPLDKHIKKLLPSMIKPAIS